MNKTPIIDYNPETLKIWQDAIEVLQLYEPNIQNIIKPQNLIDYILTTMELMTQVKHYNQDSFIIALINYAVQITQLKEISKRKPRMFMTQFIHSFQMHSNDPELAYFTHLLSPVSLEKKTSSMFKFYLKVRKYIFTNYVNHRESYIKPIKFDDWVTIVAKFLDNSAITEIGNRIKDQLNNSSTEKVFKNTVQPLQLLIFVYEYYEQRNLKIDTKEATQFEEEEVAIPRKSAQQLAYSMIMNSSKNRKPKFKQVIKIHENLAYNYKILANFVADTQDVVQQILNGSVDMEQLEQIVNFKTFSQHDAIQELHDSQIYDII